MTEDFLGQCTAQSLGNPMLDQIRSRSSEVVLTLYRFAKNVLIHAIDNDAVAEAAESLAHTMSAFAGEIGGAATVTLTGDSTFVCGQLLRASKSVYESAMELTQLLSKVGVSECSFERAVTAADVIAFGRALGLAFRDPEQRQSLLEAKLSHVTLRQVDTRLKKRQNEADLPIEERIVQLYATALVVMRGFYSDIAKGVTILPHKVKRLAQRIVVLGDIDDVALLGMTAMSRAHRDDAGRAVQSAILAFSIGRQLTRDRVELAQLVMAALVADMGRSRVLGLKRREQLVPLAEDEDARVPAATAVACLATGGVNPANALRTAAVVEASWLARATAIGPLWEGSKAPLLASEILALVGALLDGVAPRDTRRPLTPMEALEAVVTRSRADRSLLRLLVVAMGVLPMGTVVELATGEWAVVRGSSKHAVHLPVLRLVTDRQGRALDEPVTLDLGEAKSQRIARVVDAERTRFNVARALIAKA